MIYVKKSILLYGGENFKKNQMFPAINYFSITYVLCFAK